jgi:hypothetical protein
MEKPGFMSFLHDHMGDYQANHATTGLNIKKSRQQRSKTVMVTPWCKVTVASIK